MNRLRLLRLAVPLAASASLQGAAVGNPESFVFRHDNVLGTSMELRVRARDSAAAARAEAVALAEVDRLARVFSGYSPDTEFSRWAASRDTAVPVSAELFDVLHRSERWREATHGAFNPTAEAFGRLWKQAAARDAVPSDADLADAVRRASAPAWRLDATARTARRLTDCPITLNAIAKGYIIEVASDAAWKSGPLEGLMLEIGGDLRVRGGVAEPVAVADPRADAENATPVEVVPVRDAALATSGSYRRGFDTRGRHFSHIVDPRTGQPVDHVPGATVIAPDAATADALSTALSVMDPDDGIRLADRTPGVACLLVLSDGRRVRSARWPASTSVVADVPPRGAAPAADAAGDAPMELLVNFEVNQPDAERYHRPYVAIWVEDGDAFPVRTLLLWVLQSQKGQRWIPDLRRWHRADGTRRLADDKDLVATVSGATRNPGKYSVVWDGKDDAGAPVKPGKYTLYIEAAREHGSYQLMKHEVAVGGEPFTAQVKGNEEIKGASLDYRRRHVRK